MLISDDALAQSFLNRIGYYRLSGYWYPYRESIGGGASVAVGDKFRAATKFSEVVELYVFDKKLRLLMMVQISNDPPPKVLRKAIIKNGCGYMMRLSLARKRSSPNTSNPSI